ncbi:hypothetical protein Kpol_1062p7 [Vanderwaltozyma polyspora DSM 70294]|uniref:RRM domain-containing protein n=1 Tax=Vanderwaltozyma polyspora (strain ATCC 22028 / DSM 70294 / BCRC 21397 / CBS 2163 / NBRC 10782 / NRRL Y-8283 / UCD 57-17) TaxID=436907 RepID=A7TK65_VANPO|nr:uncharacterized protein Kpol_1062p7 [Vanderwaltozyma polyspora DSM 70294]EDO17300.1 hypothetical protein Kpol_1062p7 [Vanderwaltozyma polyspora DSM 70294]
MSNVVSELEQLANTNLITIRIKWLEESSENEVSQFHDIIHNHKGFVTSRAFIEDYEYLRDEERLKVLEENKEVFLFEQGSKDLDISSPALSEGNYDSVIQAQFKNSETLHTVASILLDKTKSQDGVTNWSVSINEHALTHPGNLYIKGIPKDLSIDDLVPVFSTFGDIISMKIIQDSITGISLGYGFLSYRLGSQSSSCMSKLNGQIMNGSTLFINYHVERKERERIYWDHFKENTDSKKFRGVFIGNLPIVNPNDNELITPEQVLSKFKEELSKDIPVDVIISYYFPKQNSQSNLEYSDTEDASIKSPKNDDNLNREGDNEETCPSQFEDCPLKGYGFIKFSNHEYAVLAIEKFKEFEWFGHKLTVNKAIQNKPHHSGHNEKLSTSASTMVSNPTPPLNIKNFGNPNFNNFGTYQCYFPYGIPPSANLQSYYAKSSPSSLPMSSDNENSSMDSIEAHQISNGVIRNGEFLDGYNCYNNIPFTNSYMNGTHSLYMFNGHYNYYPNSYNNSMKFGYPRPMKDQQESNIYIKHIPFSWKDEDLYEYYKKYGEVISAKVITVGGSKNKDSKSELKGSDAPVGTSKGYGFVYFKNPIDASRAILETDRRKLDKDHTLHVSFAQKRSRSIDDDSYEANVNQNHNSSFQNSKNGNSRRFSYNDYSPNYYNNYQYMNNMRQQHRHSIGHFSQNTPNYIANATHWNMHMMQPVTPINLTTPAFISRTSPISMPYMLPQQAAVNGKIDNNNNNNNNHNTNLKLPRQEND